MNNFENLIVLKGDRSEIDRFLGFIARDEQQKSASGWMGFNKLNELVEADHRVRCLPHECEEHTSRLVVYSRGESVVQLVIAASSRFALRFEVSCVDADGYAEDLAFEPKSVPWQELVIEGGRIVEDSHARAILYVFEIEISGHSTESFSEIEAEIDRSFEFLDLDWDEADGVLRASGRVNHSMLDIDRLCADLRAQICCANGSECAVTIDVEQWHRMSQAEYAFAPGAESAKKVS
jgi:hypothetical protein